jgi:hypothetical protein
MIGCATRSRARGRVQIPYDRAHRRVRWLNKRMVIKCLEAQ